MQFLFAKDNSIISIWWNKIMIKKNKVLFSFQYE